MIRKNKVKTISGKIMYIFVLINPYFVKEKVEKRIIIHKT
jgi:hypothetical protein